MVHTPRGRISEELGAKLKQARKRSGLSLRDVADGAGISARYVCLLERGERCPSLAVARDLAKVLKLDKGTKKQLFAVSRTDAGRSRMIGQRLA